MYGGFALFLHPLLLVHNVVSNAITKFNGSGDTIRKVSICSLPICPWAPFLAATCFCLIDSLILSTSFWYRARSLCAPSLASFRACSNDFTRSCVARRRFSSFGSSHLRSALSLTSCEKINNKDLYQYI